MLVEIAALFLEPGGAEERKPPAFGHGYTGANLAGIRHMLQVSINIPVEEQQPFKKQRESEQEC
jgi:hypothetical protein